MRLVRNRLLLRTIILNRSSAPYGENKFETIKRMYNNAILHHVSKYFSQPQSISFVGLYGRPLRKCRPRAAAQIRQMAGLGMCTPKRRTIPVFYIRTNILLNSIIWAAVGSGCITIFVRPNRISGRKCVCFNLIQQMSAQIPTVPPPSIHISVSRIFPFFK